MTIEIQNWERKHYVPDGGEPFLFYVLYGNIKPSSPLSRKQYRSNGHPKGIQLASYGPSQNPDVPGSFREGYLWNEFVAHDPKLAAEVEKSKSCMIMQGTPQDSSTLNYLRDAVGLITYLLDQGGCAIYDPLMFRWWSVSDWKQQIFDPASPVPRQHTVILVSAEENSTSKWFHTRGMRKFGRPDISVHNVPPELEAGVLDLCNRLIEHLAFGNVIADGQKINLKSLPCRGVAYNGGDLDDPDFNNVHIEVKLAL